jgi:hypothetical protein
MGASFMRPQCNGSTRSSNLRSQGSNPWGRAKSWGEPGGPGAKLQPSKHPFDSDTPLQLNGDMREQANPAGCEPAFERIDTAMSPQPG